MFQGNYKTENAIAYSASEQMTFQGIYLRNETPISYNGGGVVSYLHVDGSKVSKDSVIAHIYGAEQDIVTNNKLKQLNSELSMLQKVQNPGTTKMAQPDFLSDLIYEKYRNIASYSERGDMVALVAEREELLTLMNIMQIVIGKEVDYNARIQALQSQIASLETQKREPQQMITVNSPGYFVSYTDGYESRLTLDAAETLTIAEMEEIIQNENGAEIPGTIGKIIDGYQWKMIGVIDNSRLLLTSNTQVTLYLASAPEPVDAVISDIKSTDDPKKSIVILDCDQLNYSLVQHRVERVDMVTRKINGIKVPRKAIRFKDGEKGVYVSLGRQIIFKKIHVLFEGDDYVISQNTGSNGDLLLYDDIIVEGVSVTNDISSSTVDSESSEDTEQSKDDQKSSSEK